jgi:hypothetical protein
LKEKLYSEDYLKYQVNRSWLRKTIRKLYLWQVRKYILGNVIDFGCGVGEHLSTFNKDSLGLEINKATVTYCQQKGLNVKLYNPKTDNYELKDIPEGKYQTLVISHVLEHLTQPDVILKKLMASCARLGIKRIFIVVPCDAGYAHDNTHLTFISKEFIQSKGLENYSGFKKVKWGYFPLNIKFAGKLFVYNEFYILFELI